MDITIIGAEITDEQGLGPCYRVIQRTPHGIELYVLPRSAIAEDMELYGTDDPSRVLDWRLHGYRGKPMPPNSIPESLRTAALAREIKTAARHPRLDRLGDTTRTDADIDRLKADARRQRDAETAEVKQTDRIVDDPGYGALRALVTADAPNIAADRTTYRETLTPNPGPVDPI